MILLADWKFVIEIQGMRLESQELKHYCCRWVLTEQLEISVVHEIIQQK